MREFTVPDGMALSIFQNKYSRRKPNGEFQTWAERVSEVVQGNFLLDPRINQPAGSDASHQCLVEYRRTMELAVAGVMPFSGRHMQHGDTDQPNKILELFSNCSTAMFSFMLFRLLLRGSGVGRDYSTATCRVDWSNMPDVRLVLDESHADFDPDKFRGWMEPLRDAKHKYDSESERVRWFTVDDSREGWSKIVEILETAAWQEKHADKLFIFDFSKVRPAGSPIMGLQGRPASGPLPLMDAIAKVASIKAAGMKPWKQALFIDHYLASCVQLGGARRAARMATKHWRDRDVIEFIDIKRGGYLWSANNSLTVDQDFWKDARQPQHSHARRVFEAAVNAAYWDKTGEPGFINVDLLTANSDGIEGITSANCIDPAAYTDLHRRTRDMIDNVLAHVKGLRYPFITNPCSEIVLSIFGGYCLIGDSCLANAVSLDEALDAVGLMARFLVRCNRMKNEYSGETARTNRIGVSLAGIHEFAWQHFGLTFHDMIGYYDFVFSDNRLWHVEDPTTHPAHDFWMFVNAMREHVEREGTAVSQEFGMNVPHTFTTLKPGGTIPKVMACSESANLPALAYYLRWVQYKKGDAALADMIERGYPMKDVSHRYPDHVVVGFPTRQRLAEMMGDQVVTAADIAPDENFKWLRLLEHFWLGEGNNQISYTMKYSTDDVSYAGYMEMILEWQPKVRCCSVMPQSDWRESERIYSYVPEQPITKAEYDAMVAAIKAPVQREAYDDELLACEGGVCPIEADINVPTSMTDMMVSPEAIDQAVR